MVKYYRLFDLLKRKDMKISDLRGVVSSATVAKLSKHQHISGECIDKICRFLQCQPSDMMEIVESESEREKRENYEKLINNAHEQIYNMIVDVAQKSGKNPKDFWLEYLKSIKEKDKTESDFKRMKEYVENRLNES